MNTDTNVCGLRLLFVTPCTPGPDGTGWEQRAFSFLQAYARFAEVELWLILNTQSPDPVQINKIHNLCVGLRSFTPDDLYPQPSLARRIGRLFSFRWWYSATVPFKSAFVREFREAAGRSDIVHFFHRGARLACLLKRNVRPLVWDMDEVPGAFSARAKYGFAPKSGLRADRHKRRFSEQIRICSRIYVSSSIEAQELDGHENVRIMPNVVSGRGRLPECPGASTLLFVGNLNFPPNVQGLQFFLQRILPILQRRLAAAQLLVVGRAPKSDLAREVVGALERAGVEIQTDVSDVTPFYERATACIAPIQIGGGTRIKIIEAFSFGRPVVSTTKGCEGLNVSHERHLLIADDPDVFASFCIRVLTEAKLRRELSDAAFEYYLANHTQHLVDLALASDLNRARIDATESTEFTEKFS